MDLSKEESILPAKDWVLGEYYNVLKTVDLPQQEALSFSFDGKSFVYNTEYHESEGDVFLYKLTCQKKSE